MKNSNDTSWDRTSDLPICSSAPQPLCYRGPIYIYIYIYIYMGKKQYHEKRRCSLNPIKRNIAYQSLLFITTIFHSCSITQAIFLRAMNIERYGVQAARVELLEITSTFDPILHVSWPLFPSEYASLYPTTTVTPSTPLRLRLQLHFLSTAISYTATVRRGWQSYQQQNLFDIWSQD